MHSKKFDFRDLDKLNRPERLQTINPDLIWSALDLRLRYFRRAEDFLSGLG